MAMNNISATAIAEKKPLPPNTELAHIQIQQNYKRLEKQKAERTQDAILLAKIMMVEAESVKPLYVKYENGSVVYTDAAEAEKMAEIWKMNVGEVVLNRVASPEFPNTVREVIYAPGQYEMVGKEYFEKLIPTQEYIDLAFRLLNGERHLKPSVVFQSNYKSEGSSHYLTYYDKKYGYTYFAHANNMKYYQKEKNERTIY